jgi:hypothetical protein
MGLMGLACVAGAQCIGTQPHSTALMSPLLDQSLTSFLKSECHPHCMHHVCDLGTAFLHLCQVQSRAQEHVHFECRLRCEQSVFSTEG